jgi:UTP-glucose-1-phosphate uridylyltransferase
MKAVIPAAGLGTRFLPLTKEQPKEMLPVVDRPAIHWVVEEAVRFGVRVHANRFNRSHSQVQDGDLALDSRTDGVK